VIKTVLAPGAPWPVHALEVPLPEKPKVQPKPKAKTKPKKKPSKIARTNLKYLEWAGKNLESAL
jgi:hypothetical protein